MSVVIETTIGSMTIDLFTEERPRTCLNFLKLCKIKYYNFCPFHKIIKDFIAQTGRLTYNNDRNDCEEGGKSIYSFIYGDKGRFLEAESKPRLKHQETGTLSMVTNDDRLIGSEFFFTLGSELDYLDNVHTVFGRVVEGIEILYKLNEILTDKENKPYKDILITHTTILFDPFEDLEDLQLPVSSPVPDEELLNSDSIYIEQGYDENAGKTQDQLNEEYKDKQAKSRAIILEMVGDLPDADCAPPDNVLFVCKLNAVTKSDDLKVIFSRFGKVIDCEVICDSKSGESLQYAFIEFEYEKDCEQAYFKMDNVLIDDRRIHVDFSQSVAKFKWKKKMKKDELKDYDKNGRRMSDDEEDKRMAKKRYLDFKGDNRRDRDYDNQRNVNRHRERSRSIERKFDRHYKESGNRYFKDKEDVRNYRKERHEDRRSRRSRSREKDYSRRDYSKERRLSRRSRSKERSSRKQSKSNERKKSKTYK